MYTNLPTTGGVPNEYPEDQSMWGGDRYVSEFNNNNKRAQTVTNLKDRPNAKDVQLRTLRQSRLFITYSLHRAVTSEMEARHLMERMADAAYELFGNDVYLAELLVFGYKMQELKDKDKQVRQSALVSIQNFGPQGELLFIEGVTKEDVPKTGRKTLHKLAGALAFVGPHANATKSMQSNYAGSSDLVDGHSPLIGRGLSR